MPLDVWAFRRMYSLFFAAVVPSLLILFLENYIVSRIHGITNADAVQQYQYFSSQERQYRYTGIDAGISFNDAVSEKILIWLAEDRQ